MHDSFSITVPISTQPRLLYLYSHDGTTEEGNCSYLLPRAAAAGSNGTNKGQIPKVPVDEFAWFLMYRMNVTRSQLSANTGIPVCLVREIWPFKIFTGKEVTPLHEEGNSLQFRAGKKATHFHYNWFIDIWKTDTTERKERSQCEINELEICVTMWWADENHVSDTTTWRCQEHDRDRMATFETHLKNLFSMWNDNKMQYFMGLCRSTLFGNILTGLWVYFMWRWILSD